MYKTKYLERTIKPVKKTPKGVAKERKKEGKK